jgi:hypothetical protein
MGWFDVSLLLWRLRERRLGLLTAAVLTDPKPVLQFALKDVCLNSTRYPIATDP